MKPVAYFLLGSLLLIGTRSFAQTKIACISIHELMTSMPEFKKADTTLSEYRAALEQQFEEMRKEYETQLTSLTGPDTAKFTRPQISIKRESLAKLLARLQGYEEEAGQLLTQKKSSLLLPIQKKAEDAIQQVSKDNGYAFVFEKETLHVYPQSEDLLPLVKKRLGLR